MRSYTHALTDQDRGGTNHHHNGGIITTATDPRQSKQREIGGHGETSPPLVTDSTKTKKGTIKKKPGKGVRIEVVAALVGFTGISAEKPSAVAPPPSAGHIVTCFTKNRAAFLPTMLTVA